MPREQIIIMLRVACTGLISANKNEPFAPTKAQAMQDINKWRNMLRSVQV